MFPIDKRVVPIVWFPGFGPSGTGNRERFRDLVAVWFGCYPDELFVFVVSAEDVERAIVEATGSFAVKMSHVAGIVVIDHHLEALPSIVSTDEKSAADTPIGFHVD